MPPESAANPLIPMVIIGFIIYFLVIKPERQKQKDKKTQIANLKKNDHIVSIGGIHATVVNVKPSTIVARVDDSVKIEMDKEAVATVVAKASEDKK